tara:strand:- start:16245 stop:17459 length:1215 start_codon:yes stop_codon:yes gene_type:complete
MGKYKLTKLSKVTGSKEDFLWYPYVPSNATTLLTGTGGSGKSFFALDMACKLILNRELGNGLKGSLRGRSVAYISTEETADNSVNRINSLYNQTSAEKIFDKIHFVMKDSTVGKDGQPLNLSDEADREDFFSSLADENVGLVVFDPLTSFVGQNRNNANGIRMAFEGLNESLQKYSITAIGIGHLTKPQGKSTEFRVMGSTEWISCVRSSLMMAVDMHEPSVTYVSINKGNNVPEEEKSRYLAYMKSSNTGKGLRFNDDLITEDFDFSDHVRGKQPKTMKWEMAKKLIVTILSDEKFKTGIAIGSARKKSNNAKTLFGQFERRNRADLKRQGQRALAELLDGGTIEKFNSKEKFSKTDKRTGVKNFAYKNQPKVRINTQKKKALLELQIEKILRTKMDEAQASE